jgi:hypothetical protein
LEEYKVNFLNGIRKKLATGKSKLAALAMMAMVALMAVPMAAGAAPPSQEIDFSSSTGFSFGLMDIMNSAWGFLEQFNVYVIFVAALIILPTLIGLFLWVVGKLPKFKKASS